MSYLSVEEQQKQQDLVSKAQNGDLEAFSELTQSLLPYVKYIIKKVIASYAVYVVDIDNLSNEDIMQAGFLGLIGAVNGYDRKYGVAFTTYAYRGIDGAVRSEISFELNRSGITGFDKAVGLLSVDDEENGLQNTLVYDELTALDEVISSEEQEESREKFQNAIKSLTEDEKKILFMINGIDMEKTSNHKKIARELGVSEIYVKNAINSASKKMAIALGEYHMADKKQPKCRTVQILELLKENTDEKHSLKQSELLQVMRDPVDAKTGNAGTLAKAIDEILLQINPIEYSEEDANKYRIKYKGYENDLLQKKLEVQTQRANIKLNGGESAGKKEKAPSITELQYVHDLSYEELDQIIQAVSFSSAIVPEEKARLIGRLCNISSKYYKTPFYDRDKEQLNFNPKGIYSRTQTKDKEAARLLGENLTKIQKAINQCIRIRFIFNNYNEEGSLVQRSEHEVSPYYIVVYHDMYYLICGKEGKETASHFRIDLMSDIMLAENERGENIKIEAMSDFCNLPSKDVWNPEKYMSEHLYMSYDQPRRIKIKIKSGNYTMIHDWFGSNYRKCRTKCEEGYDIVEVVSSPNMMVHWAMQYADSVEVLDEEIRERISDQIERLRRKYGE